MKAAFFRGKDAPLMIRDTYTPIPSAKQVLIKLHYAAVNHRDLWITREQGNHFKDGVVLGSDGSGIVHSVGEEAEAKLIGKEVVINPSFSWGNNPAVQGDSFRILGFPDQGTFAEYIAVHKDNVFEKPEHLSFAEAAALPLAGLTAYRALFTKARLRPGEKILITGVGGGTAHIAVKLALAFGAKVFVTSGSEEKINKAVRLGATGGVNYHEDDWVAKGVKRAGVFDIILDGTAGRHFGDVLEFAAPGGRIVLYGRTTGDITGIVPRTVFFRQLSIHGTTLGTRDEFLSLIDFVEKHKIRPDIDKTFELDHVEDALRDLQRADRFGKIVLQIAP